MLPNFYTIILYYSLNKFFYIPYIYNFILLYKYNYIMSKFKKIINFCKLDVNHIFVSDDFSLIIVLKTLRGQQYL